MADQSIIQRIWRGHPESRRAKLVPLYKEHPRFFRAIAADAAAYTRGRGDRPLTGGKANLAWTIIKLCWTTDAFFAHACYRAKAALLRIGIPLLPRVAHGLAMATAQICIDDLVVMQPGVYFAHGQFVAGGFTKIDSGAVIFPWSTVGLRKNPYGPTIGKNVHIGSGARIIGQITVGDNAEIGANAVVLHDVPAGATVVGIPARIVGA